MPQGRWPKLTSAPSSCLYSLECVEGKFCELRLLRPFASLPFEPPSEWVGTRPEEDRCQKRKKRFATPPEKPRASWGGGARRKGTRAHGQGKG